MSEFDELEAFLAQYLEPEAAPPRPPRRRRLLRNPRPATVMLRRLTDAGRQYLRLAQSHREEPLQ